MVVEDNKLIGEDVVIDDKHYNMISNEENGDDFEYVATFEGNIYLLEIDLPDDKRLELFDELLLCVCDLEDNVKNSLFITRYDVCEMFDNYEFSDGSWKIDLDEGDIYYMAAISIYNHDTLYASSNEVSRGYLFGKKKELE